MKAIAPALLFVPAMSAYRGYFQGRQDMTKIAVSQVAEQFFRVVLGLTLAYLLMKSLRSDFWCSRCYIRGYNRFNSIYALFGVCLYAREKRA